MRYTGLKGERNGRKMYFNLYGEVSALRYKQEQEELKRRLENVLSDYTPESTLMHCSCKQTWDEGTFVCSNCKTQTRFRPERILYERPSFGVR